MKASLDFPRFISDPANPAHPDHRIYRQRINTQDAGVRKARLEREIRDAELELADAVSLYHSALMSRLREQDGA